MDCRWLFGEYTDPDLDIPKDVKARAIKVTNRYLGPSLWFYILFVIAPPPVIAMGLTRVADDWLAGRLGISLNAASLTLSIVIVLLTWPWATWMYQCVYTPPYRRALRTLGVPICERCGYALEGIDPNGACPECGKGQESPIGDSTQIEG